MSLPQHFAAKFSDEYKRIRKERDRFTRKLRFAAFLADKLRRIGVDSVLVGGSAVEVSVYGWRLSFSGCGLCQ